MAVGRLGYYPISPNYHTTLLMPGVTVWSATGTVAAATSPSMNAVTGPSDVGYATIIGTNASLICGNVTSPVIEPDGGTYLEIYYMRSATGTQQATLDMSGLDNFTFGGGVVRVGSVASGNSTRGGCRGTLILAKTNFILAACPLGGIPAAPIVGGFNVGVRTSTLNSSDYGDVQLGVTNAIWTDHMKIGSYSSSTGMMRFQASALAFNPVLTLRNTNGIDRISRVGIGDCIEQTATITANSFGTVDLTGGTVDALVESLAVGRNMGSGTTSRRGGGNGTLTWTAGTFDVTDASIGSQGANNRGSAVGVVNVLSNASLVVGTTVNIGGDQGTATGTADGTLNIAYGGQVTVANDVVENSSGADGSSTINLTNGTLTVGGSITVDTINLNNGTVSNATFLTATVNGNGTLANIGAFAGTLNPGTLTAPGTVTNLGNFIGSGSATLNFSLSGASTTPDAGVNDYLYVAGDLNLNSDTIAIPIVAPLVVGTYRLIDYTGNQFGTFNYLQQIRNTALDETTANQVNLVVSGGGSNLVWTGAAGLDWDVVTSDNWNNGSGTDKFYQWDTVIFDDTAVSQTNVNLATSVYPVSVTVNSTNPYTFAGPGAIAGPATLTKTGDGTLTVNNANSFTGAVSVNGGALLVNGTLGSGAVTVNNSGTLGGIGTIPAAVTVQSGGTLSPGASIGTLTITKNLTLASGSSHLFELDSDTLAHDLVTGVGTVSYGGTLVVSASGSGTALTNGAAVQLFSATTYAGSFATYSLPTLTAPLHWDTSGLASSGTLRISSVSTTPTNLSFQVTGNTLDISWPVDHTGWRLLGQTNAPGQGLSTNWSEVPGSATTNQVSLDIDPSNGSVFYRLVYP